MPRQRDYAAEYRRRVELGRQRAATAGKPFDLSKARGHGSREEERTENRLRRWLNQAERQQRSEDFAKRQNVKGLVRQHGYQKIDKALADRKKIERAYMKGDMRRAKQLYANRDTSLPDWLFWYHGVFA